MNWQQLKLSVNKESALKISDGLTKIGAVATSFAAETPQNYVHHNVGEIDFIGTIEVTALFNADFDRRIVDLLFDQDMSNNWQILADHDWQNKWKEGLKPINFNNRLSVVPSWLVDYTDSNLQLKLDAGAAFGTGTHATTYLCLDWLTQHIHGNETMIDFGCGSGILGIAAALLGATKVVLTDCDELALSTAHDNATLNAVTVAIYLPAALPPIVADIVVANILASTLKELYPTLLQHVRVGGQIVLSGILAEQAVEIKKIYGEKFALQTWHRDEWVLIFGTRF